MPSMIPKTGLVRVLIATTKGPVEVERIKNLTSDASLVMVGGSSRSVTGLRSYRGFVAQGSGVVADHFGHAAFRLELSDDIHDGESWQLAVFIAHALHHGRRLAKKEDTADCILWATGEVNHRLRLEKIGNLADKIRTSLPRLAEETSSGKPIVVAWPDANSADADPPDRESLQRLGVTLVEPSDVGPVLKALNVPWAEAASATIQAPAWNGPPYKGLDAFGLDDSPVFFGRSQEREEALARLRTAAAQGTAFLLLHGSSGVGKSSLAHAGLLAHIPTLASEANHWRTAVLPKVQPERSPLQALVEALTGLLPDDPSVANLIDLSRKDCAAAVASVTKALAAAGGSGAAKAALLIDQLEDCLSWSANPDSAAASDGPAFADMIERLARSGTVWIIATLRSDLLPKLEDSAPLMRLAADLRLYRVKNPTRFALRDMVTGPAHMAGLTFAGHDAAGVAFEDLLVDEAARSADSLPLLQFTLRRLYDLRDLTTGALTFEAYQRIGGLGGAIGRYAEEQSIAALGDAPDTIRALENLVLSLARFDPAAGLFVGRTAVLDGDGIDPARVQVIEALAAARLIVVDHAGGKQAIRLAHEALLSHWPRAHDILIKQRESIALRDYLEAQAAAWHAQARDPSFLQTGLALSMALRLVDEGRVTLSALAAAFIEASDAAAKRTREAAEARTRAEVNRLRLQVETERGRRRWASAASVLFLAMTLGAGAFWWREERSAAEIQGNLQLASNAVQTLAQVGLQRFKTLNLPSEYGRDLFDTARALEDEIAKSHAASPTVLAQQATLLNVTADYAALLGDRANAEKDTRAAIAILQGLVGTDPETWDLQRQLAAADIRLGKLLGAAGTPGSKDQAKAAFQDADDILSNLHDTKWTDVLPNQADTDLRASLLEARGRLEAEGNTPADATAASGDFQTTFNMRKDFVETDAGKFALAGSDQSKAEALLGQQTSDPSKDFGEAERYLDEASLELRHLLQRDASNPLWRQKQAEVSLLLGNLYVRWSKTPCAQCSDYAKKAKAAYDTAGVVLKDLTAKDPANDVWRNDLRRAENAQAALSQSP